MDQIQDVSIEPLVGSQYIRPHRIRFCQNGRKRIWDATLNHNSVAILIHNITRDVFVFVKQFRPAVYLAAANRLGCIENGTIDTTKVPAKLGITHEMCAGIIDKDKSLEEIAVEEVYEECGYKVAIEDLEKISSACGGVGVSGALNTQYYVQVTDDMKVGTGGGNPDESEFIELAEIPVKESLKFIMDESIPKPFLMMFGVIWFHQVKLPLLDG